MIFICPVVGFAIEYYNMSDLANSSVTFAQVQSNAILEAVELSSFHFRCADLHFSQFGVPISPLMFPKCRRLYFGLPEFDELISLLSELSNLRVPMLVDLLELQLVR